METGGEHPGTSELAILALLTAGESPDDPAHRPVDRAVTPAGPGHSSYGTYAVSLQTMALAAADPVAYQVPIARNAAWLEAIQIRSRPPATAESQHGRIGHGSWSYHESNGNRRRQLEHASTPCSA